MSKKDHPKKPETRFESDLSQEEVDAQFSRMSEAMDKVQAQTEKELHALAAQEGPSGPSEDEAAAELARQIAEDDALAAQEKAEAERPELSEEFRNALPRIDDNGEVDRQELESCIEALLFLSDKPVALNKLHAFLAEQFEKETLAQALESMRARYASVQHGIELVEVAGGYQFRTKMIRAPLARKLSKVQVQRLSRGAMETLTLIAYKQPCLKEDIDQVRGVDSSHFIRGLLDRGLIEMAGRSDLPGRPIVYQTTDAFLQVFSLKSIQDLPPLQEIESMIPASENLEGSEDERNVPPEVRRMRKLVSEMNADPTRIQYDHETDEQFLSDIRERVKAIPVSTPYLEGLKAAENEETEPAKDLPAQPELQASPPAAESEGRSAAESETPSASEPGSQRAPDVSL